MSKSFNKSRKTICILTSVHPVFDTRIFHKEAKTLAQAGYEVVLIAQHSKEETVDGIKIIPLPKPKNRLARMLIGIWRILVLAIKQKGKVYHFHDPELIPVGICLRLLGKKVICDVHEDYGKQILYKPWLKFKILREIIALVFDFFERTSVVCFNGIIAATEDISHKFSKRKTILLRNFSILQLSKETREINSLKKTQRPVIIYSGGLMRVRGIKEIIEAIILLEGKVELWLLGEWENAQFQNECSVLNKEYIKYLGLVPFHNLVGYTKNSDIGIVNFYSVPAHVVALPNKPFEYMACGLPMVMSDFPYWREMFSECAVFTDPYNPRDIAAKISYLINNPDIAKSLGEKGRFLVQTKYNWEKEGKKLLDLYQSIYRKTP